ncbi:MAG: T9SS type A sorting domain-containing protein, partial [Bacteroidota bacterium]
SDFGVGDAAVILSATTDEGCSHTDVLVVTIEACVGIGEMMSDVLPVVYPNPSDGQVTIRIPERFAGKQLILTDAVGRTTLAVPSNREMKLQLDDLQPGIYLVRIEGMQAVRLVRN